MSGVAGGATHRQRLVVGWSVSDRDYINLLAWSRMGQLLACASADGGVAVYAGNDGRLLWRHSAHGLGTTALAWAPDGQRLASGGQDGRIVIWEAQTGESTGRWKAGRGWVEKLAWSQDGLLAGIAGKELRLWDHQGALRQAFEAADSTLTGLALLADGSLLTSGYGQVSRWRPGETASVGDYVWKGSLLSLAVSPDGKWIAAGSQEGMVQLWPTTGEQPCQISGYTSKVRHLCWSHDGRLLAIASGEDMSVWDCADDGPEGKEPDDLPVHFATITAMAFSPVNMLLASGAQDGGLFLYDAASRQQLAMLVGNDAVSALCWHPQGECLTVGYADGTVTLLRLSDRR